MYALRDADSKLWFNGIDDRYSPARRKMSRKKMTLYNTEEEAKANIPHGTDKSYELCRIYFTVKGWYHVE